MDEKQVGKKIVGAKQTVKAVNNDMAKVVYIAKDADDRIVKPVVEACGQKGVEIVYIDTMDALGKLCGIDVKAATACLANK